MHNNNNIFIDCDYVAGGINGLVLPCTSSQLATYGKWECGDGNCILMSNVCDGYYDCLNGHDELDCGKLKTIFCLRCIV